MHGALEMQLLEAIEGKNAEILKRCLRIFATVDRVGDAEKLVRNRIIRPHLEEVISEKSLNEDPMGLKGLFSRVLKVIPDRLSTLLQLTGPQPSKKQSRIAKDYDFLTNAFFPEVVELLDDNLGFIFSAGNPEKFFVNYKVSMEFLLDFERELKTIEAIEQFREKEACQVFLGRWNLPVYFQIKFQEIALPVEKALGQLFQQGSDELYPQFKLQATSVVVKSINQCWDSSVYLDSLAHRFWKLTLQIVSRFSQAVLDGPEMTAPMDEESKQSGPIKPSPTTLTFSDHTNQSGLLAHQRSSSESNFHPSHNEEKVKYKQRPKDLINLYLDITEFAQFSSSVILRDWILPRFPNSNNHELLTNGLEDGLNSLRDRLPFLSEMIVKTITEKCLPYLRQVSDIPRLYRRTNRDIPSKPCTYLTTLLVPITTFQSDHSSVQSSHQWMVSIFDTITAQYLSNVSEVLAAVQKMEESLRRLKRVRDTKTFGAGQETDDAKSRTVSDDDKIRLQLFLDVHFLIDKMEKEFKVKKSEIKKLDELENIVTEATNNLVEFRVKEF